jgi:hypothetical protein
LTIFPTEPEEAVIHQWPVPTPSAHESVPQDVKKATIEAEKCLSVGCFNACGTMTRRAVDAICEDKGAEGENLYKKLERLKNNNQITPALWEWAEDLRIVGRSGAHPEWPEVTAKDAEYAVRFLRDIIKYVYVLPAERQAHRLKETKKKRTSEPPLKDGEES